MGSLTIGHDHLAPFAHVVQRYRKREKKLDNPAVYNVYRLTERLGYKRTADFLDDMRNGAELTGWIAYLNKDDEIKTSQMAYAIAKAFGGGEQKGQKPKPAKQAEDEEIIDTTDPEFAKNFQGFTYAKPEPQQARRRQTSTEILFG